MNLCENLFKINKPIVDNCKSSGVARAKAKWYINLDDLDKTGTVFASDLNVCVTTLVLKTGAKVYPIPGQINQLMFSDELSRGDYVGQAIHKDQVLIRNLSCENIQLIQKLLLGARIITINELTDGRFNLLGYENGLILTEGPLNPPENDGGRLITLSSPDSEPESTVIKNLLINGTSAKTLKWLTDNSYKETS